MENWKCDNPRMVLIAVILEAGKQIKAKNIPSLVYIKCPA